MRANRELEIFQVIGFFGASADYTDRINRERCAGRATERFDSLDDYLAKLTTKAKAGAVANANQPRKTTRRPNARKAR